MIIFNKKGFSMKKKLFLLLLAKNFINSNVNISSKNINSCFNNTNFFEVVIPIRRVNNMEFYLPNNLNEEDKKKIFNFIFSENKNFNNLNNNKIFYKIIFNKNYETASLNDIILYENDNNHIRNIKSFNNIEFNIKEPINKIIKKNKKYLNIITVNFSYSNKNNIHNIINESVGNILELLKLIDDYMKKYNNKDYFYKIFYNKQTKKILGIKIFNKNLNEIFYILYTKNKRKYLILNKDFKNIKSTIIGLYKAPPLENALKKLGSKFSTRRDPFTKKIRMHRGQDIRTQSNTPIRTVEDGVVVDCGYNKSYGYFIIVHHGNSTKDSYSSVYCHLNTILLPIGTKILKNQVIGLSGSTGRSTGPHLHFEWVNNYNGNRIDPLEIYYKNKKIAVFFRKQLMMLNEIFNEIILNEN